MMMKINLKQTQPSALGQKCAAIAGVLTAIAMISSAQAADLKPAMVRDFYKAASANDLTVSCGVKLKLDETNRDTCASGYQELKATTDQGFSVAFGDELDFSSALADDTMAHLVKGDCLFDGQSYVCVQGLDEYRTAPEDHIEIDTECSAKAVLSLVVDPKTKDVSLALSKDVHWMASYDWKTRTHDCYGAYVARAAAGGKSIEAKGGSAGCATVKASGALE